MQNALGEAAWMTGLERNADIVSMACYAPLFANWNNQDWTPDLIYFNGTNAYGTPSYYVQQMFAQNRGDVVKQFQEDPKTRVFLISIKAGGVGLNLTEADYVFILDPWWNPAVEQQAIDRTHRIGQTKNVFIYKFITKDTVEEKILALQQRKLKVARSLITTEESFIKSLSAEDIKEILG